MSLLLKTLFCLLLLTQVARAETRKLTAKEYYEKVYANWIGQCIGNFYGLLHENEYIEEIPDDIPREYGGWPLEKIQANDGAFSDDDTDIEYMYVFLMEEKGVEPTYADIAERWRRHINHHIWVANYDARTLMGRGFLPPDTGRKGLNPNWFQIDPQLVNEVWAVTAPGMVRYAAAKSDWAARVTNDDFGTDPTIWYGAMYSAAFFESDMKKLYDIGLADVPHGRFREALVLVRAMHREGRPWRETRKAIKEVFYDYSPNEEQSRPSEQLKSIFDAPLNGAMGALALLYGEGDFEETLYLSCMAGFDCDNQAATLSGLFGVAHGYKVFPKKFLYPVESWTMPFNNRYRMVSRDGLPHDTFTNLAKRTVRIGEQVIKENGGKIITDADGERAYEIDSSAEFVPPLEIRWHPVDQLRVGQPARLEFYVIGGQRDDGTFGDFPGYDVATNYAAEVRNVSGEVPGLTASLQPAIAPGDTFASWATGRSARIVLSGTPLEPGLYELTFDSVSLPSEERTKSLTVKIPVLGENLADNASKIIARVSEPNGTGERDLEVLRDGRRYAGSYNSYGDGKSEDRDWYGYEWSQPQQISQLIYTSGEQHEEGDGWWQTFDVEYKDSDGNWKLVEDLQVDPSVVIDWHWPFRPHTITFTPIRTRAIRIIGTPGAKSTFTSVAELEVYAKVQPAAIRQETGAN
jgi:hypothetical protein